MSCSIALGGVAAPSRLRATPARARRSSRASRVVVRAAASDDDADVTSGFTPAKALSFLCPLLKVFSGGDAAAPRNRVLEVATSGFASISRLPFGTTVDPECAARDPSSVPSGKIILYEFEACPFCRRVREALTQLDLTVEVRPCPKDARTHRAQVQTLGGKQSFPFLVDENTGVSMYESEDIVRYLYHEYGAGAAVPEGIISTTALTGWMPTLFRAGRGMTRYPTAVSFEGKRPLTLYNYEGNQFARLVREALCELEVPYALYNCGKGSPRRNTLREVAEGATVPYLEDPNTGFKMGESDAIVAYLFETYGGKTAEA